MFIRDQPRVGKGRRKDWTEVEVGPNAQVFRPYLVRSLDTGQLWRLWPQVRQTPLLSLSAACTSCSTPSWGTVRGAFFTSTTAAARGVCPEIYPGTRT